MRIYPSPHCQINHHNKFSQWSKMDTVHKLFLIIHNYFTRSVLLCNFCEIMPSSFPYYGFSLKSSFWLPRCGSFYPLPLIYFKFICPIYSVQFIRNRPTPFFKPPSLNFNNFWYPNILISQLIIPVPVWQNFIKF